MQFYSRIAFIILIFLNYNDIIIVMTKKQNFLLEHNKLSPLNLHTTLAMLTCFRKDKPALFKDNEWSIDKLRRPFILWLTSSYKEISKDIKIDKK